ncbi:MAG: helix-turn-helix transcriptional regulator [Gemmatimonadetes bacterium]|nr:helix-turn-helix transcriptional regulator [Gemmatimonadota bacterium]
MPPARRATPRRPRWRRRPEDRPEEILRAALRVFAERGFAQARLEEVARKAGVSKGTLYLYFDSKDALFRAVVRATKGPILAESEAWLDAFEGSAREALAHFIGACGAAWPTRTRPPSPGWCTARSSTSRSWPASTSRRWCSAPAACSSACSPAGWRAVSSGRTRRGLPPAPCRRWP